MGKEQQATLVVIEGRPTHVMYKLNSVDGALVQCRMTSGEDAYVPLRDLFTLFARELASELRLKGDTHG